MCWPYTRAGEIARQRCPDYIIGFKTDGNVYNGVTIPVISHGNNAHVKRVLDTNLGLDLLTKEE